MQPRVSALCIHLDVRRLLPGRSPSLTGLCHSARFVRCGGWMRRPASSLPLSVSPAEAGAPWGLRRGSSLPRGSPPLARSPPAGCARCADASVGRCARCASSAGERLASADPRGGPQLRCAPTPSAGSREGCGLRVVAGGVCGARTRLRRGARPCRRACRPPCLLHRFPRAAVAVGTPRVVGPGCSPVTPPWEGACLCGPAPASLVASPPRWSRAGSTGCP